MKSTHDPSRAATDARAATRGTPPAAATNKRRAAARCVAAFAATLAVLLVWAFAISVSGTAGIPGAPSGGLYVTGEYARAWARDYRASSGSEVPAAWNKLPFCWPSHDVVPGGGGSGDPLAERKTSLYDYMTWSTTGASPYVFPVADVRALPALDPDAVLFPGANDTLYTGMYDREAGITVCENVFTNDAGDQNAARQRNDYPLDTPLQRWRDIADSAHVLDMAADGDLPVVWYDEHTGTLHRGLPLSPKAAADDVWSTGGNSVYTHHDFVVWLEHVSDLSYKGSDETQSTFAFVRVVVRPSNIVTFPLHAEGDGARNIRFTLRFTATVRVARSSIPAVRRLDVFYLIDGAQAQAPIVMLTLGVLAVVLVCVVALLVCLLGRNIQQEIIPRSIARVTAAMPSVDVGKKWVHVAQNGEVFRRPARAPRLFAALIGAGAHVALSLLLIPLTGGISLLFARFSVAQSAAGSNAASPIDRLVTVAIVVFAVLSTLAGAVANWVYFGWVLFERTADTRNWGRDGVSKAATEAAAERGGWRASPPLWAQCRADTPGSMNCADAFAQRWLHAYVDTRLTTLTSLILPVLTLPLLVPVATIQGAQAAPVAVVACVWVFGGWVVCAAAGHVAVAAAGIDATPPIAVGGVSVVPERSGAARNVVAPFVWGTMSSVLGGVLLSLSFVVSVRAGGYMYVFVLVFASIAMWFTTTGSTAVTVVWMRLINGDWRWHWVSWWTGASTFVSLFAALSIVAHVIVRPELGWASVRVWYYCALAALCMALAHGSVTYLATRKFVWTLYTKYARAASVE